jgi:hypothetical protein
LSCWLQPRIMSHRLPLALRVVLPPLTPMIS